MAEAYQMVEKPGLWVAWSSPGEFVVCLLLMVGVRGVRRALAITQAGNFQEHSFVLQFETCLCGML